MKTIKVGFVDTFDGVPQFFMDQFKLFPDIHFLRDDERPDILFFSDENFGMKNREERYFRDGLVRIFYTGENRRYHGRKAHYAITFDHEDTDQHFRMPLWILNLHYLETRFDIKPLKRPNIKKPFQRHFCGFVQANPNCEKRNQLYSLISGYRQIDSAGPLFNNTGFVIPRGESGVLQKMKWLGDYKFSLAIENGQYSGYTTEKVLEAYLAGTIPIHWGSPTIPMDFNTEAMINWHDFKNDQTFLDYIKAVDQDEALYMNIYEKNLFDKERFDRYDQTLLQLNHFLGKIIYRHLT